MTPTDFGAGLRILIVEDEAIVAMLLEDALRGFGHSIVGTADTTAAALALARDTRPDLVLCDIKLLNGDSGLDVARGLQPMGVACLFVSGNCPEPALGRDLAVGCLLKPFNPRRLQEAIAAAWHRHGGAADRPATVPAPNGLLLY